MSIFSLTLPAGMQESQKKLVAAQAYLAGSDGFPVPTQRDFNDPLVCLRHQGEDTIHVATPWLVQQHGLMTTSTTTLMCRESSYRLLKELARGKVNQVRCQTAEWENRGLVLGESVKLANRQAGLAMGKVIGLGFDSPDIDHFASKALTAGFDAARELIRCYCGQLLPIKKKDVTIPPTVLAFYMRGRLPDPIQEEALLESFNGVQIAIPWREIEKFPGRFDWKKLDNMLAWAKERGLRIGIGPIIDLNKEDLPEWFLPLTTSINKAAGAVFRFVDQVIERVRGRVDNISAIQAGNFTDQQVGDLDETEWLRLTFNTCQKVRQILPEVSLGVGVVQPWGELLAHEHRDHNPFLFAEALSRSLDGLGSIDIELALGYGGRGSGYRDLLELARLLEQLSSLGCPIKLDIAPPPAFFFGTSNSAHSPYLKQDWCNDFFALAFACPMVTEVRWLETFENERTLFPGAGLFDKAGMTSECATILSRLTALRSKSQF